MKLDVQNVSIEIGNKTLVNGLSFSLLPNKILGIVGESGCGKTTLVRVISGLQTAKSGTVSFGSEKFDIPKGPNLKVNKELRKNIRLIFQNPDSSLNPDLTIGEILSEPLMKYDETFKGLGRREKNKKLTALIKTLGLSEEMLFRYPAELSVGQKRKLTLIRALSVKPKLLIADEPVDGQDIIAVYNIMQLIKDFKQTGSVIVISHHIQSLMDVADCVLFIGVNGEREFYDNKAQISNGTKLYKFLHP